jgi:EAL domain-containing protein (putative c-di-GMP-specific phosphodiesterase class I)
MSEQTWLHDVVRSAEGHADAVRQLLHAVRTHLGMELAWTSEFVGSEQVFRFVDADPDVPAPEVGSCLPLSGSYCARVLDGRVPALIPESRSEPATALLEVTRDLHIGSYVGVPLLAADGSVAGMLCATSRTSMPTLSERDVQTMRLLAQLLHDLQLRALDESAVRQERARLLAELHGLIEGDGRWPVLQPIVDVTSGRPVLYEGLMRFRSSYTPAQWFDVATRSGLTTELELAAARSVLDLLRVGRVPDGATVSVNLSPATVVAADLATLLAGLDPGRVVLEVTEHHEVHDYEALRVALAPWRARGLRLAVDDAGAGYASLKHVLLCAPDLVKLDMALVRGIGGDRVRQALVRAVLGFCCEAGMTVVAEGVESEDERAALVALGVPLLQGYLLGRPSEP